MELKELLKNDLLKQIYYGEIYLSRESPNTPEYRKTLQKMKSLSEKIRRERGLEKCFDEYCEMMSIKESLETELHFEMGFKTAIRLILYGITDEKKEELLKY